MADAQQWPPFEVQQSLQRLSDLQSLVKSLHELQDCRNEDVVSNLARLLVVRCSGHLEVVSSSCILSFIERHSESVVSDYARNQYKKWQNPTPDNLKNLLSSISNIAREEFSSYMSTERATIDLSAEIGSMVKERGKIAHGDNDSVTPRKALQFYQDTVQVSYWFTEYFKPLGKADNSLCRRQ